MKRGGGVVVFVLALPACAGAVGLGPKPAEEKLAPRLTELNLEGAEPFGGAVRRAAREGATDRRAGGMWLVSVDQAHPPAACEEGRETAASEADAAVVVDVVDAGVRTVE